MESRVTRIEVVTNFGDLCGEAPLWDADTQTLLWSDCVGKKLYKYKYGGNKAELLLADLK